MKTLRILIIFMIFRILSTNGQCNTSFLYNGVNDTISFTNNSNFTNGHYYWNFGDGTTSYQINPIHIYPESGKYLVTLFGIDTISTCHTYSEIWINVAKPTSDSCDALITDTIFYSPGGDFFGIYDLSQNCSGYNSNVDGANFQNSPPGCCHNISAAWSSAIWLNRIQFNTFDTINGVQFKREYYRTMPWNYSSSLSYDSCSANFEYSIDIQPNGAYVSFKAMNQNAISYDWELIAAGSGNTANITHFYQYIPNIKYAMWLVILRTEDSSGCRDTVTQTILIKNFNYGTTGVEEFPPMNIKIFPSPAVDYLMIAFDNLVSSYNVRIYNVFGNTMKTKQDVTNLNEVFDITDFPAGIYIMEITQGKHVKRQTFIKQ